MVYYLAAIGVMLLVAWVGLVLVAWRDRSLVAGGLRAHLAWGLLLVRLHAPCGDQEPPRLKLPTP